MTFARVPRRAMPVLSMVLKWNLTPLTIFSNPGDVHGKLPQSQLGDMVSVRIIEAAIVSKDVHTKGVAKDHRGLGTWWA